MRAQISVHLAVLVLVAGAGRAGATDPPPLAQPKQPQYEFKRATFRGVIKRLDEKSLDLDGVGGLPTSRVDVTGVWRFSPTPILALGAQRPARSSAPSCTTCHQEIRSPAGASGCR